MLLRSQIRVAALACIAVTLIGLTSIVSSPPAAAARAFKVRLLLDNTRIRPDTGQPFSIFGPPVIEGSLVVFATWDGFNTDAIWSIDINTKRLKKLVGTDTRVPRGQGTFSDFNFFLPTVGGGTVAFFGNSLNGLYTVPIDGGRVKRIAATGMRAPDGGTFDTLQTASVNGIDVVFGGHTTRGHHGVYQATIDGTELATVIDERTKFGTRARCSFERGSRLFNFTSPVIGGGAAAYLATGSGPTNNDPNGVAAAGELIADNLTRVQSDRDRCPHMGFLRLSAPVQNGKTAFFALDYNVQNETTDISFQGIFIAGGIDHTATRLVSNTMRGPVSRQPFGVFSGFGYDATGLAFTATEGSGGQGVYFIAAPGEPIHNIAFDLRPNFHSPKVGDRSVSNGAVAFADGDESHPTALWIATPVTP